MIEKPDIPDEKIVSVLLENYSIPVTGVDFLPLGLDSSAWAYRVDAKIGAYFLKLRKEIPNPAGILIPRFLKEQGIGQVMAPLSTKDGAARASADDFFFIVYPFITGERVMDVGMSDVHWAEFGSVLKQLHTTKPSSELSSQIKRETFIPKQLEFAKALHTQVKTREYNDPFQKELAEFWLENYGKLSTILQRTEFLAKKMRETNLEFVLCHADIHTGNVLLTEDNKLFIVDWDETMLAPKERDLLFIIGSIFNDTSDGRWEQLFFEGYGETEIDTLALAYYRYDWCVEDIGSFAEDVFGKENTGEATKANSIWWFKNLFAQGNSVEAALTQELRFDP
jgi:spectinomycin phosphotransferase